MNTQRQIPEEPAEERARLLGRIAELESADAQRQGFVQDLELIFQISPTAMCLVGMDGRIQRANAAHQEIYGYTEAELQARPHRDFLHPGDADAINAFIARLLKGESVFNIETRVCRPDGSVRLLLWTGIPLPHLGAILCLGQDITQRRQDERLLHESQRRLSTLMSNLPGMAYRCANDPDWTMQFVSEGCLALTGHPSADLLGNRVLSYNDLIHPDDRQRVWESVQAGVAARQHFQMEYRIRTAAGAEKWVWEQGAGVFAADTGLEALEGFICDVTARKQAEAALHESAQRFRQAMEATNDGLWDWNVETGVVYYSPAYYRMLGFEADEFPAALQSWTALVHPDDLAVAQQANRDCIENRVAQFEVEFRMRTKAGDWKWVLGRGEALCRDARGHALRMIGTHVDITERKQAEAALQQAHAELEERVQQRTAELRLLYDCMTDGLAVVDAVTAKVLRVNAALCKTLGFTEAEVLRMTLEQRHPQDELPGLYRQIALVRQGAELSLEEMPCLASDGRVVYFDTYAKPIVYAGRNAIVVFMHDVTERRRAREALTREQRTLTHLLQSSDHERQLIAYEIHDGLAQHLAGAIMQFEAFQHLRDTHTQQAADAFHAGVTMLRQGHFEARRLISGVRPPILDEEGIVAAVAHLVNEERRKNGPVIDYLSQVEFARLTPILENAVYRIAQEALANACRHSRSKKVWVELVQHADQIRIEVRDQGQGFVPEDVADGRFGLEGIRERARLLGGQAFIKSRPGAGTRITVQLPVISRRAEDEAPADTRE